MKLPEAFVDRTRNILGQEWESFLAALEGESPVSIRLNPKKISFDEWQKNSLAAGDGAPEAVGWARDAYYLPERPVFTLDPLLHAGCYYVQEASSMYVGDMIRRNTSRPVRVLDLCAAPGGKSTQISSLLSEGSLLVSNEVIRQRAHILAENLAKWGNPETIVANNDPRDFQALPDFFDVVVADVPCSGEGMFRKDRASIAEWSEGNVRLCADRQRRIVADVWPSLKNGGLLVYSTCTYNKEENEDNVAWICRELGAEITEEPRRFWPHKSRGEGFFVCLLRKNGNNDNEPIRKEKNIAPPRLPKHPDIGWLREMERYFVFEEKNNLLAIPKTRYNDYLVLKKNLRILSAGVDLGEIKGKDIIPAHALAMSTALDRLAFPSWEVETEDALRYLRREALQSIPADLDRGFVLIFYKGQALGFAKNIGNRANNLYPQEWRIRKL